MKVFTIKSYGFEAIFPVSPDINMASHPNNLNAGLPAIPNSPPSSNRKDGKKGHKQLTPKMVQTSFPYWENPEKPRLHSVLNKFYLNFKISFISTLK